MIKIRPIRFQDLKTIQDMLLTYEPSVVPRFAADFKHPNFILNPVHNCMPINFQFLQQDYVAVKDKQIIGLIGIKPDGKHNRRWNINQLLIVPDLYDVGSALIDYVVSKYGGEGVETFITEINIHNTDVINLLKNTCGFRSCTTIHLYEFAGKEKEEFEPKKIKLSQLRPVSRTDADKLYVLNLEALKPEVKVSLERSYDDYKFTAFNNFIEKIQGLKIKRMGLEIPYTNSFAAYIFEKTTDNHNYQIGLVANQAYQAYYEDLLQILLYDILHANKNANVLISVPECIQSSSKLISAVEEIGFKKLQTNQLLVKDYWKPIKNPLLKVPFVMLSDGSPVCNS